MKTHETGDTASVFFYLAKNRQIQFTHFFLWRLAKLLPFTVTVIARTSASSTKWEPEVLGTATEAVACGRHSSRSGLEVWIPFRASLFYEDLWYISFLVSEKLEVLYILEPTVYIHFVLRKLSITKKISWQKIRVANISFLAENPEKTLHCVQNILLLLIPHTLVWPLENISPIKVLHLIKEKDKEHISHQSINWATPLGKVTCTTFGFGSCFFHLKVDSYFKRKKEKNYNSAWSQAKVDATFHMT